MNSFIYECGVSHGQYEQQAGTQKNTGEKKYIRYSLEALFDKRFYRHYGGGNNGGGGPGNRHLL